MRTMLKKVGKKLETFIWDKKFQQFTFHDAMELGFGTLHTLKGKMYLFLVNIFSIKTRFLGNLLCRLAEKNYLAYFEA